MKHSISSSGYYTVGIGASIRKPDNVLLHRLLAETFLPNPEGKHTINHINGNKLDNRLENLEWATYSENAIHAINTGLNKCTGESNYRAKFRNTDIRVIKDMSKHGFNQPEIASLYGVHQTTIHYILTNKHYSSC